MSFEENVDMIIDCIARRRHLSSCHYDTPIKQLNLILSMILKQYRQHLENDLH